MFKLYCVFYFMSFCFIVITFVLSCGYTLTTNLFVNYRSSYGRIVYYVKNGTYVFIGVIRFAIPWFMHQHFLFYLNILSWVVVVVTYLICLWTDGDLYVSGVKSSDHLNSSLLHSVIFVVSVIIETILIFFRFVIILFRIWLNFFLGHVLIGCVVYFGFVGFSLFIMIVAYEIIVLGMQLFVYTRLISFYYHRV